MQVSSYFHRENVELVQEEYMTAQYIDIAMEYLDSIKLSGRCAFLYAGGVLLEASESRNTEDNGGFRRQVQNSTLTIKEVAAFSMHKYIGMLADRDKIEYANVNGNTCASCMYSLYEAERLLESGFDEVVIVAEERTSYSTLKVFAESRIDLKVGEGIAIVHLKKGGSDIRECKWTYEYNRNPFAVSTEGYRGIDGESDYVNPHGTCTPTNEDAEQPVVDGRKELRYKEEIGHTQGASGLIEVCKVLDEDIVGDVLCMTSGLGGFYGSCIVHKG